MFRCVKCGMTFTRLEDLLTHFVREDGCRVAAFTECLVKSAGVETLTMIFDTSYGKVDCSPWISR